MAQKVDIDLVKLNLMEDQFPQFDDKTIETLLDRHKSVPYVSYKLALMKAGNTDITLGPVSVKTDADYWKGIADMFLREYEQEQAEELAKKQARGTSGVRFLRRVDGT